jgi:hypothetical protein
MGLAAHHASRDPKHITFPEKRDLPARNAFWAPPKLAAYRPPPLRQLGSAVVTFSMAVPW